MKPAFFTRGLWAASVVLSLAACGGGNGTDAGAATAAGNPAPTAQKPDGSTADTASSPSVNWAP